MRFFIVIFSCILYSCTQNDSYKTELTGEALAKSACASCHAFTEPSLLPKEQWKSVLPHMGLRLGIESPEHDPFPGFKLEETQRILAANVFPNDQLIEDSLWIKLQQYFIDNAPDTLQILSTHHPIHETLFKSTFPELPIGGPPFISMVKFIHDTLYISDRSGNLMRLDDELKIQSYAGFPRPIIDIASQNDELLVLSIGDLYPNDRLVGGVARINGLEMSGQELLFEKLARPVHFSVGDMDSDGRDDLVISNFGNYVGDLSWYQNKRNAYERKIIKPAPGATRTHLHDLDNDGDLDIVALFAQGDEGVSVFYNDKGLFTEKRMLRFHPLSGNNDMEMADMDGDGDLDIVLSNGDNGDHSITLKPYHGIRIFLNDGEFNFTEHSFHPFYGSSKVRIADFDLDGDMDIIAASFFPDARESLDQSIMLLTNRGDLNFEIYSIKGADEGRWMVMDTGDIDKDGDTDVIIGSFTLAHEGINNEILREWRQSGKHIMALENQTIP